MSTKLRRNQSKNNHLLNNIIAKKMNRSLLINARLRRCISVLSSQNKDLSAITNSLLLQKLELENEKNSIKNVNIQLTAMHHSVTKKLDILKQNLQNCVPALVTLSKYIPSMQENVHDMLKFNKLNEFNSNEKKERQTKSVKPMVNGLVIEQPAVRISPLNLSPIVEIPFSEQSPMFRRYRQSKVKLEHGAETNFESHSETQSQSNLEPCSEPRLEPYVRLKDVATLLKNSKSVKNKNSRRQQDDDHGEGPSWLYTQENLSQNPDLNQSLTESSKNHSVSLNNLTTSMTNEMSTPVREKTSLNEIQSDFSTPNLSTNSSVNNITYENQVNHNESMTPDSSLLRNITIRKRNTQRSSESSIVSNNESFSSLRPSRSGKKQVNYKETKLNTKLRRD